MTSKQMIERVTKCLILNTVECKYSVKLRKADVLSEICLQNKVYHLLFHYATVKLPK